MTSPSPAVVLGRFPPPLDGQALATERTAELIEANRPVVRVSTTAAECAVDSCRTSRIDPSLCDRLQ